MEDTQAAHGHEDPNAAPMHHDIQQTFSKGAVIFCYVLAAASLLAGVIAGLTIVAD